MSLETSIRPQTTANSQKLAVTAATVHSTVFTTSEGISQSAVVTVTTNCFMRMTDVAGTVVASDGTDQYLVSGNQYRVEPIPTGYYLHFIRDTADGYAYITSRG